MGNSSLKTPELLLKYNHPLNRLQSKLKKMPNFQVFGETTHLFKLQPFELPVYVEINLVKHGITIYTHAFVEINLFFIEFNVNVTDFKTTGRYTSKY
jgi:hypothetical protein